MKKLAVIITLLICGSYIHAEYKIPYAVWSFYPKPVNLKLSYKYPTRTHESHRNPEHKLENVYKIKQVGTYEYDKYIYFFPNLNPDWVVDVSNVQPKTVHQWEVDVAKKDCSGEECMGVIIKIVLLDPATNQIIMTTPGAWHSGIGNSAFIHFVILPDGTMAQVKQIYYDGGIVTRDGYVIRGAFTPQGTVRKEHEQTDMPKAKNIPIITKEGNLGWQD